MHNNLLTPKQLAELFAVNENTIAQWRVQGNGPKFVKIQRRIRYAANDVDHWMNERTFASTTAADASLKFGGCSMITSNTAAKAATTIQSAILKNEGDSKNKKEINMPIYNTNYVLFDKTNLSNLPEVVLDHISSTLTKEGIGHTSFDWKCLILERSPEFIAIEACECCGNIKISANLGVENPYGHTHEFVEQNLGKLIHDEWCKALSFCDKEGHIISLEMIVPCNGSSLLNFSTSMEEFEQKLKSFLAVASKLGLEIVIDDDAELTARSN